MLTDLLEKISLKKTDIIIVGCSSGPDSMALLHYLHTNLNNKIICCHINHNVRKESKEEEEYLKNYCKENNITFEHTKITNYKENNFENEARKKRYSFYEKTLKKYNSKYLFLAHHGDDLIETILMKINRGSNLDGYAGIKEISNQKDYIIVRPLLNYTKEDLINYLKKNNIKYYIDSSNKNQKYTRNRYRENILPFLKKEDPNIHKKYLYYSKVLQEYQQYIDTEINNIYNKIVKNNTIDINKIKTINPFLQKNLLFKILNTYYNNEPNIITSKHIESIIDIIYNITPNQTINLPKKVSIIKSYNNLYITNKNDIKSKNYKIILKDKNTINNHIIEKISNTDKDGNDICRLNSKEIKLPLYIRNKKNGDKIEVKGLNGTKKISDIFIEKKLSSAKRIDYPLLVDKEDNIIWIPNLKKSKFNKQKNEFCDIILRYREKEEKNEQ